MTNNFEAQVEKIEAKNEYLIKAFAEYLKKSNLSPKTISTHASNMEFFLNHYLARYELKGAEKGIPYIDGFLGDWFIRKAMWSSKAHIFANIAALKKFYFFLYDTGRINIDVLKELNEIIADGKEFWMERMEDYKNGCFFDI